MKAVGVVVEYNPFHNGHLHHLEKAKQQAEADIVIAVMSGSFLQRGEPAMVDKWSRTKMALASGVDLVIELPYVYSTAQASEFAKGAISLLSSINCHSFAFGSEEGSIKPFLNTFSLIEGNRELYESHIKTAMQTGISYPKALHFAYESLKDDCSLSYIDLTQPNNILGYHYVEAAHRLQSPIQPQTIQRIAAGYHDLIEKGTSIASATGIRKALAQGDAIQDLHSFMPKSTFEELTHWHAKHTAFASWEKFWPLLRFTLTRHTPKQLTQFAEVSEGIEFALNKAIHSSHSNESFELFMHTIKSKRYTWTRLQRMLTHIYTGTTKEQLQQFDAPRYIRLLGMSQDGQKYLSQHKKEFSLPLISRVASVKDDMLALDIHAADMYAIGMQQHSYSKLLKDYQTPPIRF
ncbi:MAG: nucleotidyltransferase [Lysinibacillus sp.]